MNLLKVALILLMFGVWIPAPGQSGNLLKNPGGDEGTEHWRAFKDAKVEQCPTGGPCFVLRGGGYFIQDVVLPKDAQGQYALLTGRAYSDTTNVLPSLSGYLMNSGDPSGGRIYGYLTGQQMRGPVDYSTDWTQLWGVFRIKPGTRRIRFFLQQHLKTAGSDGSVTRFDDLKLYVVATEQAARGLVSQTVPGASFGPTNAIEEKSQCWVAREVMPSLYGIQLGMSLQDVLSRFPQAMNELSVVRALESSKSPIRRGPIRMLIVNRSGDEVLREVKQLMFEFLDQRLFSLTVELLSPQWKDVEEFIDQRGTLLNLPDLPQASAWEPVDGNAKAGKYLICHGIEIRFYAAPLRSTNMNLLSLTDTTVEAAIASGNLHP